MGKTATDLSSAVGSWAYQKKLDVRAIALLLLTIVPNLIDMLSSCHNFLLESSLFPTKMRQTKY